MRKAGSMTWAPVSPPAVVVLARSSDGWSWLKATRVTPATTARLAHPGQADRLVSRRDHDVPVGARAGAVPTGAGAGATSTGRRSSQTRARPPRASGATTAATAIRLKVAWATMFMPRRPVR